jgi:hypothetical protein
MSDVEVLAKAELANPETVSPEYERWQKANRAIQELGPMIEATIAEWLQEKGLTATTTKHIWLFDDLETYEIREGQEPADALRPDYLKGIRLNICQFRLPGVVIKFKESEEERYFRLKRTPKAGELEALLRQLEAKRVGGNEAETSKDSASGAGSAAQGPSLDERTRL